MTVVETAPDVDRAALLAGAQFVNAYSIVVDGMRWMHGRSPRG